MICNLSQLWMNNYFLLVKKEKCIEKAGFNSMQANCKATLPRYWLETKMLVIPFMQTAESAFT